MTSPQYCLDKSRFLSEIPPTPLQQAAVTRDHSANSNNENSLILFEERQGTHTAKHGEIARLAEELNLPGYKNLGFYRLNDAIVTGADAILDPWGLNFIPLAPEFQATGEAKILELLEACDRQAKYQCSILLQV